MDMQLYKNVFQFVLGGPRSDDSVACPQKPPIRKAESYGVLPLSHIARRKNFYFKDFGLFVQMHFKTESKTFISQCSF